MCTFVAVHTVLSGKFCLESCYFITVRNVLEMTFMPVLTASLEMINAYVFGLRYNRMCVNARPFVKTTIPESTRHATDFIGSSTTDCQWHVRADIGLLQRQH